ncbi:hypothetical protein LSH36_21g08031 [Paralvinella palmiformis]|uniref:Uncharacterized protein n=1 Tax=Paralvinella palmiformis TaxID=53620 RepID=A0AAD9NGS9_9ANNE|nr:hypothetical protein LSH36_21g08031 [Paralvinella palmiformis]
MICVQNTVDELAGDTAIDYQEHICSSIDSLADIYSRFHGELFQVCRSRLIQKISKCISD